MVATTLSQSILAGMDPSVVRNIQNIENGDNYLKMGMDASPTTSWGAIGRLANALAGSYIQNSSASDLAKSLAAGKKQSLDDLLAGAGIHPASTTIPSAPPALAPSNPGAAPSPSLAPQAAIPPEPGSANAQVANRFPADWSPGTAASPLPNNAPSPLDTAAYPQGPVGAPTQVAGGDPNDPVAAIDAAASKHGVNPDTLHRMAMIESSGNPNAVTGSARGLFQFMPETARQYGLSDPFDPAASADAAARLMKDNKAALTQALGREPTEGELYLAHQQGAEGAAKLLANPNAPAVSLVGQSAVTSNGGSPGMTAGQFANKWTSKFGGAAPVVASDAEEAAPKPGQQVAQAGDIDVHRLMAVMQNPYADDATKALASKLILQQLAPKEDEFASSPQGIYNKRTGELKQAAGISGSDFGGLQGKDLLAAVQKTSPAVASQVTAIIEGRAPYPTGSRLNPVQQQVKELVTQVDPTFEAGNSGARIKVRNEFNTGGPNSPAAAITAGNTAIQHLGHLSDEAEKLGNFDSGIPGNNYVNEAKNAIARSAGGGIAAGNFDSIRNKYIEEATKFYRGTGGNESDLQRDIAALNSAQSPSQLRDVIKTQADLMQSKINALQERWKHGMGPLVEDFPIIHPESQSAIDRINLRQAGKKVGEEKKAEGAAPAQSATPDRAAIEAEMRKRGLLQ